MDSGEKAEPKDDLLIMSTCSRLKLPPPSRAASQIIYGYVLPKLRSKYPPCRLALASVYLAAKATESGMKASAYKSATGFTVDVALETAIVELLGFRFDFFDIHGHTSEICRVLRLEADDKLARVEKILGSPALNRINFIDGEYEPFHACLAAFSDGEIGLFERVFCVKIDRLPIAEIRATYGIAC